MREEGGALEENHEIPLCIFFFINLRTVTPSSLGYVFFYFTNFALERNE